jgi:hypothetical protein
MKELFMATNHRIMAKSVLAFLFLFLLLAGCSSVNTPLSPEDTTSPTAGPNIVETLDALRLTQTAVDVVISSINTLTAAPPEPSITPAPSQTITPANTSFPSKTPKPTVTLVTLKPSNPQNNPTQLENRMPGSSDWSSNSGFTKNLADSHIAGYADASSVNIGESIHFAISTQLTNTQYALSVYRMGWYDQSGARKMLEKFGLKGQSQGYWDPNSKGVQDCPTCQIDSKTGLVDAHWTTNYTMTIPSDWVSGLYLVKLVDDNHYTAYIPFVLRDDKRQSDILVQIPIVAYQAKNLWGGNSLFSHNSDQPADIYGKVPAVKVSFNRPYHGMSPSTFSNDLQLIRYLEKHGYDVTYTTSVDLDRDPGALLNHRAFLDAGQDYYWTRAMRDGVENGRDAGINLAFFGSNTASTQVRLEPDKNKQTRRVLVLYHAVQSDPLYKSKPAEVTGAYSAAPLNRPQNGLLGMSLTGSINNPSTVAWVVSDSISNTLLDKTGLTPGDQVKDLAGSQCNAPAINSDQPQNLVILGTATYFNSDGKQITCNTSMYQASSGAYVFYAGSTSWTESLDLFSHQSRRLGVDNSIVQLTENVLEAFGIHAAVP